MGRRTKNFELAFGWVVVGPLKYPLTVSCSKRRCAGLLVEICSYHFLGNKKQIRFRRKCCWSRVLLPMVYGPTNSWKLDTSSTSTGILTHWWYVMSNGIQSSETILLHVIVPSDRQAVTFQLPQCGGACHWFSKHGRVGLGTQTVPWVECLDLQLAGGKVSSVV